MQWRDNLIYRASRRSYTCDNAGGWTIQRLAVYSPPLPDVAAMPHSPAEKKKALTRLRRIRGQADALERALEAGSDCGAVLQQLAAIRGAVNGLMAEVLESHLRETFGDVAARDAAKRSAQDQSVQQAIALVRSYLK